MTREELVRPHLPERPERPSGFSPRPPAGGGTIPQPPAGGGIIPRPPAGGGGTKPTPPAPPAGSTPPSRRTGVDRNWIAQHLPEIVRRPEPDVHEVIEAFRRTRSSGTTATSAMALRASTPTVPSGTGASAPARPRSIDWRTYRGRSYVTPVKNQYQADSCVAFAVGAMVESMTIREKSITVDVSEADMYFGSGHDPDEGWYPDGWSGSAIDYVQDKGVPPEHCFPYPAVLDQQNPPDVAYRTTPDRTHLTIKTTREVCFYDTESRKLYLSQVGPMVGIMDVYKDFESFSGSGIYRQASNEDVGSHCVLIIGYDDDAGCWICKNSWGTNWGDQGFFRIAYGECGIDSDSSLLGIHIPGALGSPFWGVSGIELADEYRMHYWTGRFSTQAETDMLMYLPFTKDWWTIAMSGGRLRWTKAGNTAGFGDVGDGRPIWSGNFTGTGATETLFYSPGDDNWWLGTMSGTQLGWHLAGNTRGFGHRINDGRPFWIADVNGDGRDEVLFYYPGDGNWWLGTFTGTTLKWACIGNTLGKDGGPDFGQVWDGRPFWTGDFNADGRDEVLFYSPADDNWWLGTFSGTTLRWAKVGNTAGFGHRINDGRPFWTGRFTDARRDDVLFYYPGNDNWWLGELTGSTIQWHKAGNTAGFGHRIDDGRPFWIADVNGDGRDEVLFYYPGDGNWWLGTFTGATLKWACIGNTLGKNGGPNFGQVWDGRPFWTGHFSGQPQQEVLFYYPGDGNWWLGRLSGSTLSWREVANTASQWQLS